jgi:hypothetical protein
LCGYVIRCGVRGRYAEEIRALNAAQVRVMKDHDEDAPEERRMKSSLIDDDDDDDDWE